MPARKRHRKQPSASGAPEAAPKLTARVTEIDDAIAVARLVETVFDWGRELPLLLVSSAGDTGRPRVNLDDLLTAIGADAEVAVVRDLRTTWALSNRLPEDLRAYGGAIRVFWPGADENDPGSRHPLFLTMAEDHGPSTIASIRRMLTRFSSDSSSEQAEEVVPSREPIRLAIVPARLPVPVTPLDLAPHPRPAPEIADEVARPGSGETDVEEAVTASVAETAPPGHSRGCPPSRARRRRAAGR